MRNWKIFGLIGIGVIAIGIAIWLIAGNTGHTFNGTIVGDNTPAPNFTLVDETNKTFSLNDLHGQWVLLAYGYTSCPDVCPMTLGNLKQVKADLGALADQVRVVFVSVDPERDTTDVMNNYVHHFGADFKGLTGTPDQVAAAAQAYNVKYQKVASDSALKYTVSHSSFVYLIDPQFHWRITYPFGVKPEEIASDLKYLISNQKE